jgi:hypothetical protein
MEKKICEYRNCINEVGIELRSDAKFCSNNCRSNEAKYNYRAARQINEEKAHINSLIDQYSNNKISNEVKALYDRIYNKK